MVSTLIAVLSIGAPAAAPSPILEPQIGPFTYRTVQSLMAKNEIAFVGRIEKLERVVTLEENGMRDRVRHRHGFARYTVTVKVEETFKGDPGERIAFRQEVAGDNRNFDAWHSEQTAFFFTNPKEPAHAQGWSYFRIGEQALDEVPPYTRIPRSLPMFSMDFKVLRTESEFMEAARKFKASAQRNPPVKTFWFPYGMAMQVAQPGDGALIELPIVPEMLPIATALNERPESFWARPPAGEDDRSWQSDMYILRKIGAELLELLQ